MLHQILRFIYIDLRPREGWIAAGLLALACLCLPWSLWAAGWLPGAGPLWLPGLVALPLGLGLGRIGGHFGARVGDRVLAPALLVVAAVLGGLVIGLWLAAGLPSMRDTLGVTARTVGWLMGGQVGEWPGLPLVRHAQATAVDLTRRASGWLAAFQGGPPNQDMLLPLWLAGATVWLTTLWSAWAYRRWGRLDIALLPLGIILTQHVIFAPNASPLFGLFLAALVGLLVQSRYLRLRQRWEREGVDYSDEIQMDVLLAAGIFIVGLPILAWALPLPKLVAPAQAAYELFSPAREAMTATAKRAFGGVERPRTAGGIAGPAQVTDLPYSRVLTSPPDLQNRVVLTVSTNDAYAYPDLTPPPRYWRLDTWDTYTGRGWDNSPLTERRVLAQDVEQTAASLPPSALLVQRFSLSDGAPPIAVNAPVAIDHDYSRLERAPDDLAGLRLAARDYTVVSRLPQASEAQLRAAAPIPLERYTALPSTVPARVRDLARRLTADARTDYDRAIAIQNYIRSYEYDLTVQPPPPGRDAVDYFLFDLKRGYCDYTGTAMVVLLRAVGIPARLATGYAGGSFDLRAGQFTVIEADAHAWPEVYFQGIGWVEFEPTPARPVPDRPALDATLPEAVPVPDARLARGPRIPWPLVGLALLVVGALAVLVQTAQRLRWQGLPPAARVAKLWARLVRRAGWLGHGPVGGQTPLEYARDLGRDLSAHEVQLGRLKVDGAAAAPALDQLAARHVEAVYSDHPVTEEDAQQAEGAWSRVARVLWLLRVRQ